jgi:catechol 2,3-dioxygenase-like lactoylglutathione lyase family enzyme
MIKDVTIVEIFVHDQQAALDFYTRKLGLATVQDESYGDGVRWIAVSPAGSRIRIVLRQARQDYERALVGRSDEGPVMAFGTDDVQAAHEELRQRGVRFLGEPERQPWGTGVVFLDQDGSPFLLSQEPDVS